MQSHCWYFSNDNSSESVSSGSVDTDELHLQQLLIIFDDLNLQLLLKRSVIEDWLIGIFDDLFFLEFQDLLGMHQQYKNNKDNIKYSKIAQITRKAQSCDGTIPQRNKIHIYRESKICYDDRDPTSLELFFASAKRQLMMNLMMV